MRLKLLIITIFSAALWSMARETRTVNGDYTFYGDRSHSPEYCREAALNGARVEALAREFGTIYTSDIDVIQRKRGDDESQNVEILSLSEVKGEWIADIGQPVYETSIDSDGNYVVRCKIKGEARPISNESTDFSLTVMRNGSDERNAASEFRSGDDMTLAVKTPVDGYLAVYLIGDGDNRVYSLFPYYTAPGNDTPLRRGRTYTLFDPKKSADELGIPDELVLSADNDIERNRLFVIFSPNRYSLAVDTETGKYAPRELAYKDFMRWLQKNRARDSKMGVKVVKLTITPAAE